MIPLASFFGSRVARGAQGGQLWRAAVLGMNTRQRVVLSVVWLGVWSFGVPRDFIP